MMNTIREEHASMLNTAIKTEALQDFKEHLHGELIGPGDDSYEYARRVWNGMIDKYPALIARCADVSDVVTAIRFARRQDLPVAVRVGVIATRAMAPAMGVSSSISPP